MTTARRAISCPSCGFATTHILHLRNCVPTSQWPRDLRERKAAAMRHGDDDIMEIDGRPFNAGPIPREVVARAPEPQKPRGIAEYRRIHPEANPLTTEHITVREFRRREDGGQDEWDRVVGVREAMNQAQPCPRCHRPMLDRSMHITCRAVDGSVPEPSANRLKRDDVELHPRHPVIHTTAEVRTGARWFEKVPADESDPEYQRFLTEQNEEEMRDFIGELDTMTPEQAAEAFTLTLPSDLAERLAAEQAARAPVPFTCPTCGRASKSKTGDLSHQRSHAKAE